MSVTKPKCIRRFTSQCIRDTPLSSLPRQQKVFFSRAIDHVSIRPFNVPRKRRRIHPSSLFLNRPLRFSKAFSTSVAVLEPRQDHPESSSSSSWTKQTIPWPQHANPTPYDIFNLPRNASLQEIKKQYFHLVKQYHPDHSSHPSSLERFRKVVESYKVLSNPTKRHEYDTQHPTSHPISPRHSEYRQPWSGSRLSRRKTEQKGPPGGWSFSHARKRSAVNPDMSREGWINSDVDNEHFSYERHFRRNWEREMKIKRRMDELYHKRQEYERQREMDRGTARMGFAFTAGLLMLVFLAARAIVPA